MRESLMGQTTMLITFKFSYPSLVWLKVNNHWSTTPLTYLAVQKTDVICKPVYCLVEQGIMTFPTAHTSLLGVC